MLDNPDTIDQPVEAETTAKEAAAKKPKAAKKKTVKAAKPARETSTIQFPYRDLGSGIAVAQAMIDAGGVALTTEQLAGVMQLQSGSGNFVMKVATARIFGLVANVAGKYELTDIGFAAVDTKDEKRQRQARAEAFLKVPLYRRAYDEFRGRQLPPRPHGLEQAFVRFGVSAKQKEAARLAFDKSAALAGFFSTGQDRLVEPIIAGGGAAPPRPPADDDAGGGNGNGGGGRRKVEEEYETSSLHPFIRGLLDTIPEPGTNWAMEGRAKWLQAAANIFDLIYKGSGEITIVAKPTDAPKA
jgi:hypothetical protein